METLLQDLRYGMRMLLKRPGFTVIAIISLALGIGANTAIFSLVNTALLMPPPVARPDELVAVNNSATGQMFPTISYPNYKDYRDRNEIFSGLVAYRFAPLSVSHEGTNERLWSYIVSGNYFEVLGINPAAGRLISPDDDQLPGAHPVAVVELQILAEPVRRRRGRYRQELDSQWPQLHRHRRCAARLLRHRGHQRA